MFVFMLLSLWLLCLSVSVFDVMFMLIIWVVLVCSFMIEKV